MNGLLPADYEIPTSGNGGMFAKLEQGENRFRILDVPTMGYIYWIDKTPVRVKSASDAPSGEKPKHFWHMPVWMDDEVKLMDIDKATVIKDLKRLDDSDEWGNLLHYDVIVTREGQSLDTTYAVQPCPKADLPSEAAEAWTAFKDEYNGDDVFEGGQTSTEKENILPWKADDAKKPNKDA
jgi:hypothetical protein